MKDVQLKQMGKSSNQTMIRLGRSRGGNEANLWKVLWRKLRREKRKIFERCQTTTTYSSGKLIIAYDPFSYSQNFDQGNAAEELDDLSRSFSARFALADAASRIFLDKQLQ